jgi:hypothetical protein
MAPKLNRRRVVSLLAVVVAAWLVHDRLNRPEGSIFRGRGRVSGSKL